MNVRRLSVLPAALIISHGSMAADALTSMHPESAYPDETTEVSQDRYSGLIQDVQKKLREQGFDAGPVNGRFGSKTQAALAQFQLSWSIPVSGMLDRQTLDALGVEPAEDAAASGETR